MDKNKISIDDLFRQRLADREAPVPPGAWSRMEGLLDAKMPVGGSMPIAKGRPSRGWAFLLLGVLVAGGGSLIYQAAPENPDKPAETTSVLAETGSTSSGTTTPIAKLVSKENAAAFPNPVQKASVVSQNPKSALAVGGGSRMPVSKEKSAAISGNALSSQKENNLLRAEKATPSLLATNTRKSVVKKPEFAKTPVPVPVVAPSQIPEISANNGRLMQPEEVPMLSWIAGQVRDVFSGKVVNSSNVAQVENYLLQWAAGKENQAAAPQQAWSAKTPKNTGMSVTPVLTAGNVAKPATATPPQSALTPVVSAVSTPEQKIENVVEDLRKARYTVGVLAGINSTLSGGSGALQGLHAGIVGLLSLHQKWSLGAELRYMFRLNNSMDLKDDYFSGKTVNEATIQRNGRPYNAVRYEIDSMLSRYSFTSYNSISLPLYVRYDHNRLSVYGGPSIAFHFAPSVTRSDTRVGTISRYDTLDASLPIPTLPTRNSEIALSDFDSRFSLGYHAGAQYRLTPALCLDMRLTHQLWDNRQNKSVGSRRVSETYLHIPSLQLSVGYYFGKKATAKPAVIKP